MAGPTSQSGRISNVTFVGDSILVMLDTGRPDNCAASPPGWMLIPASAKPLHAFVLGLWLRGDAAQTQVTVYTSFVDQNNYCQVFQIDPLGMGS